MVEAIVKIASMALIGAVAVHLLTSSTFGDNTGKIGGAFAGIISAVTGGASKPSTGGANGQPNG